jgi:hypothetical protein
MGSVGNVAQADLEFDASSSAKGDLEADGFVHESIGNQTTVAVLGVADRIERLSMR